MAGSAEFASLRNVVAGFLRRDADETTHHIDGYTITVGIWGSSINYNDHAVVSRLRLSPDVAKHADGTALLAYMRSKGREPNEALPSIVFHAAYHGPSVITIFNLLEAALSLRDPATLAELRSPFLRERWAWVEAPIPSFKARREIHRDGVERNFPLVFADSLLNAALDSAYAPDWRQRMMAEMDATMTNLGHALAELPV